MKLREDQINIYAIGVREANITQHYEIAGVKNRVYFVHNFDLVKDIKNEVVREICTMEVCKEVKANVMFLVDSSASIGNENFLKMKNFMRELLEEIHVKREIAFYVENFDILSQIKAISFLTFAVARSPPDDKCRRVERLDVVFVMDSSGSISSSQYQTMKDFMIALVKQSDVGPDGVQFGAVTYSGKPVVVFYINKDTTKLGITEALQRVNSLGQMIYMAKALVHSETFSTEEHGTCKSKGVPQVLLVFSDGMDEDLKALE
ncbi:unnamed protein product [Bubo scandiacus]